MKDLAISLNTAREEYKQDRPYVVVQYYHNIGHRLRKLANEVGVQVIFKYGMIPGKFTVEKDVCKKSGHTQYVNCIDNIVYSIPLSCNSVYIGQSGRCLNRRLYEHEKPWSRNNYSQYSRLREHRLNCEGCTPMFEETKVIVRNGDKRAREKIEASHISNEKSAISKASIVLTQREIDFVSNNGSCKNC